MPWRHMGGEKVLLLLILNLGTRWGWVVRATPRPRFTPGERTPGTDWIRGCNHKLNTMQNRTALTTKMLAANLYIYIYMYSKNADTHTECPTKRLPDQTYSRNTTGYHLISVSMPHSTRIGTTKTVGLVVEVRISNHPVRQKSQIREWTITAHHGRCCSHAEQSSYGNHYSLVLTSSKVSFVSTFLRLSCFLFFTVRLEEFRFCRGVFDRTLFSKILQATYDFVVPQCSMTTTRSTVE
jgi:hypothetical protein